VPYRWLRKTGVGASVAIETKYPTLGGEISYTARSWPPAL
jgi:hypothetical protein